MSASRALGAPAIHTTPTTPHFFTRHFPEDILAIIFNHVIGDHSAQPDALFQSRAPQVVLASVCSEWRELAHNMRHLWTCIPVGASRAYARECLSRSPGLQLRLGVRFSVHPWSDYGGAPNLTMQAWGPVEPATRDVAGVRRMFSVPRVRELAVSAPSSLISQFNGQRVWSQHCFPEVETLYVSLKKTQYEVNQEAAAWLLERWQPGDPYDLSWAGAGLFPSLYHLRLDGLLPPDWSLRLPHTLRSLDLNFIDAPQRKLQKLDNNSISLLHLLDDLGSLAHLEHLRINFSDALCDCMSFDTTTLPVLRELHLTTQSTDTLFTVFRLTRMPVLRRFVLALGYQSETSLGGLFTASLETFIKQLPSLHAIYFTRRQAEMGASTLTVAAYAGPIDCINTSDAVQDASFHDATLRITLTCDVKFSLTLEGIADNFLRGVLDCMYMTSNLHPIDSLALSLGNGDRTKHILSSELLVTFQTIRTLVCYDGHEEMLSTLQKSGLFGDLKTLVTPPLATLQERIALDAVLKRREGLSHLEL